MIATAKRTRRAAPPFDGVSREVLDARIASLELSVQRQSNVTAEMLDAIRPGGPENPDPSAMGALTYLNELHRLHATGPSQPDARAALRWNASDQQDVAAALAAEPIMVPLVGGTSVSVYPKSEFTLKRLSVIDKALHWAVEQRLAIEAEPTDANHIELLALAMRLESTLEREYVTVLCHPGADLPWADDGQWEHALPSWTATLTGFDLMAIRKAHLDVNLLRLNALTERSKMLGGGSGEGSPLAAFLGVMAHELAVQPREMSRRWSLGEVFAQALLKWESSERARREAEQERANKQG